MTVTVGGTVSVIVGERGGVNVSSVAVGMGVRVADGMFVFTGVNGAVGSGADVCVAVGAGAGANSLFATGGPNTPAVTAANVNTKDVINHCQPVTMRA